MLNKLFTKLRTNKLNMLFTSIKAIVKGNEALSRLGSATLGSLTLVLVLIPLLFTKKIF